MLKLAKRSNTAEGQVADDVMWHGPNESTDIWVPNVPVNVFISLPHSYAVQLREYFKSDIPETGLFSEFVAQPVINVEDLMKLVNN
jgi:hypothetical protein